MLEGEEESRGGVAGGVASAAIAVHGASWTHVRFSTYANPQAYICFVRVRIAALGHQTKAYPEGTRRCRSSEAKLRSEASAAAGCTAAAFAAAAAEEEEEGALVPPSSFPESEEEETHPGCTTTAWNTRL